MNVEEVHQQIADKHREAQQTNNIEMLLETTMQFARLYEEFPQFPQVIFSAATGFMNLGYNALARLIYTTIIDNGNHHIPEFWNNLGVANRNMHLLEESRAAFTRSLDINPFESNYYSNFSTIYINEGDQDAGEVLVKNAIKLQPGNHRASWNYSLLLLEKGELAKGFELYDAGLLSGDRLSKKYYKDNPLPVWDGSPGHRVIFYDEQGIGDRILFANCLRKALPVCKGAVIDCHPRLDGLYGRAFKDYVEAVYPSAKNEEVDWLDRHDKFDACIGTGSLPKFYWKRRHDIDRTPYFIPDPEKVSEVRKEMERYPKPWLGFAWTGGTVKTHQHARSFKIGHVYPYLEVNKRGTWFGLEYPKGSGDQVRRSGMERGLNMVHFDNWVEHSDYDWTAAFVSQLDLVISPCTSVVHLCGSMGVPCWAMVPKRRAWRYPLGPDMYWYTAVKQFHQENNGKWDIVIERIRVELMRWMIRRDYL